tara:strand:+ start:1544 stop:1768 length:225 start_codon:yes stop_codon:yes gene_type:complete
LIDILKNHHLKNYLILASRFYGNRKYLLNTSGFVCRSIGSEVVKEMSDYEIFEKIIEEPRLLKRPFFIRIKIAF